MNHNLTPYNKNHRFCICDIDLRDNRALCQLLQKNKWPYLIEIDERGNVWPIVSWNEYMQNPRLIENYNELSVSKNNDRIASWNYLFKAQFFLERNDSTKAREQFSLASRDSLEVYYSFLGMKLFRRTALEEYYTDLFYSSLDENGHIDSSLLLFLAGQEGPSLGPVLSFEDSCIDLGTVKCNSQIDTSIILFNIGDAPLYILSASPSCTCVKVAYPQIINPGENETMTISYMSSENERKDSKIIF